jgi:formylglycine-generating enzyme required for sulfatase activity
MAPTICVRTALAPALVKNGDNKKNMKKNRTIKCSALFRVCGIGSADPQSEERAHCVIMNPKFRLYLLLLVLLASVVQTKAEEKRFFRISGPAKTTITGFDPDGRILWSNEQPGATYTIQSANSLPGVWIDYVQIPTTNELNSNKLIDRNRPINMAFIPGGVFQMGDSFNDAPDSFGERPVHAVFVSPFYMDKYEVTKALWDEVYAWAIQNGYSFDGRGSGKDANHPVQSVNWWNVVKWCNARSEKEGKTPAYYTDAALSSVYRKGQLTPRVLWNAGYRLPTEAEWEKAARGGASGHRFAWSDADTITHSRANYESQVTYSYDVSPTRGLHPAFKTGSAPHTSPVGYFAPNGYGLYDMTGNVWEWCWDWFGTWPVGPQTDPRGPASGSERNMRSGGWNTFGALYCLTANRGRAAPPSSSDQIGFRSILSPDQP